MFFGDIDNPIGIDISDVSVKLVQFNRRNGKLEVAAYSDVPLPSGLVENDIVENEEGLVSFLKGIFRNKTYQTGKLKGRSIVVSIPESKAFVRVINLPRLGPNELLTAVPLEAEQYIPIPIDQMQIDWQVVGETRNGLRVFITATPKNYVRDILNVLKKAGLVAQSIEAESA